MEIGYDKLPSQNSEDNEDNDSQNYRVNFPQVSHQQHELNLNEGHHKSNIYGASKHSSQLQQLFTRSNSIAIEKYEFFNSQNLLLLMKLTNSEEYKQDPRTSCLYDQLNHYFYASDFSLQRTRVLYKYSDRQADNYSGRLYSWTSSKYHANRTKMVGLQTFPRWVRAALASDFYFDMDIVNAHPSILLEVVKVLLPTIPAEWKNLSYYCQNREKVLETVSFFLGNGSTQESSEARKLAKTFITSLFFGGAIPTGAGYNITFTYIQNQFNLHKLVEEIKIAGRQLFELAVLLSDEKVSHNNKNENQIQYQQDQKAKQSILQSLQKSYNLIAQEIRLQDQKQKQARQINLHDIQLQRREQSQHISQNIVQNLLHPEADNKVWEPQQQNQEDQKQDEDPLIRLERPLLPSSQQQKPHSQPIKLPTLPKATKSQISSFLANFLQDVERKIMSVFELAICKRTAITSGLSGGDGGRDDFTDRNIDVYIHDGCLIRKKLVSHQTNKLLDWDMHTLASMTANNSFLSYEDQWTQSDLIHLAEDKIFRELRISVKFTASLLDTKEFYYRVSNLHSTAWIIANGMGNVYLRPPLKFEDELFYYFQTHRHLCHIISRNKYLYGGELLTLDALKQAIDEPCLKIIRDPSLSLPNNQRRNNPPPQIQQQLQANLLPPPVYKQIEVSSFMELYQKRNDRARFANIELVRKQTNLIHDFASAFSFQDNTTPYSVLASGGGRGNGKSTSIDKLIFLLDMNIGFPLFFKDNHINNGSLESADEFLIYLLDKKQKKDNNHEIQLEEEEEFKCNKRQLDMMIVEEEQQFPKKEEFQGGLYHEFKEEDDENNSTLAINDENDSSDYGITIEPLFQVVSNQNTFPNDLFQQFPLAIPFFNHWYLLLDENDQYFYYVIKWIAKIAQAPGDMSNICGLIFYSKIQGIGKSLAIKMVMSLFAPFTQETQSLERVFERFSDIMELVLLLHIEDAPKVQLKKFKDELKGRMTADKIFIEKKNNSVYSVTNFCRFMLSTNEEFAMELTPEDRRWGAFECSSKLKNKKLYFQELARYWRLHQSKTDVLNCLLKLNLCNYDAERQRPKTPYLLKIMMASTNLPKAYSNTDISFGQEIEELLLPYFLKGLTKYLITTPRQRIKESINPLDVFSLESPMPAVCYYIKSSILPKLYYIWIFGEDTTRNTNALFISVFLWKAHNNHNRGDKAKMISSFKRMIGRVAPHMKTVLFDNKKSCYFYPIDCDLRSSKLMKLPSIPLKIGELTNNKEVDLIALYNSVKLTTQDLDQNLPMQARETNKKKSLSNKPVIEFRVFQKYYEEQQLEPVPLKIQAREDPHQQPHHQPLQSKSRGNISPIIILEDDADNGYDVLNKNEEEGLKSMNFSDMKDSLPHPPCTSDHDYRDEEFKSQNNNSLPQGLFNNELFGFMDENSYSNLFP